MEGNLYYYDRKKKLVIKVDVIIDNHEEMSGRLQIRNVYKEQTTDSELILLVYHKYMGGGSPKIFSRRFFFFNCNIYVCLYFWTFKKDCFLKKTNFIH